MMMGKVSKNFFNVNFSLSNWIIKNGWKFLRASCTDTRDLSHDSNIKMLILQWENFASGFERAVYLENRLLSFYILQWELKWCHFHARTYHIDAFELENKCELVFWKKKLRLTCRRPWAFGSLLCSLYIEYSTLIIDACLWICRARARRRERDQGPILALRLNATTVIRPRYIFFKWLFRRHTHVYFLFSYRTLKSLTYLQIRVNAYRYDDWCIYSVGGF